MVQKTKARVVRCIMSAFLQSDLKWSQMREGLEAIGRDAVLLNAIGNVIEQVEALSRTERGEKGAFGSASPQPLAEVIYEAIQRRRMSKKELMELMTAISPRATLQRTTKDASVREMVEGFLQQLSVTEAKTFLQQIDPRLTDDPYLRGILGKG